MTVFHSCRVSSGLLLAPSTHDDQYMNVRSWRKFPLVRDLHWRGTSIDVGSYTNITPLPVQDSMMVYYLVDVSSPINISSSPTSNIMSPLAKSTSTGTLVVLSDRTGNQARKCMKIEPTMLDGLRSEPSLNPGNLLYCIALFTVVFLANSRLRCFQNRSPIVRGVHQPVG